MYSKQAGRVEKQLRIGFIALCRSMSRSSFRDVSRGGAILTEEILLDFHRAAAWGNSASLTNSFLPWNRTAVSALATPAARLSVSMQRQK